MKVFSKRIEVPDYLCDRDDRLHTWAAIRLCQEVSELHSKATAIGYEDMRRKNMIWIISRAYYIIYKRAHASEKIMLNTWSRGNDGLFAFRDYSMEGEEGEVLMTGTSYWPLIDFTSHKPIRLNDTLATYEYDSRNATERAKLDRLKMPDMTDAEKSLARTGYAHVAFSLGNREQVDALTERMRRDGYAVISGPRVTGDGYYESCIVGYEGNVIELTEGHI